MRHRQRVILTRTVPGLGVGGDVKDVAVGYARNNLFPSGAAIPATEAALRCYEAENKHTQQQHAREAANASETVKKISAATLRIPMRANMQGRLFGSVSDEMIIQHLRQQGISSLTQQMILKHEPLNTVGHHAVVVAFPPNQKTSLHVQIIADESLKTHF